MHKNFNSSFKIANLLSLPGRLLSVVKCFSIATAPLERANIASSIPSQCPEYPTFLNLSFKKKTLKNLNFLTLEGMN